MWKKPQNVSDAHPIQVDPALFAILAKPDFFRHFITVKQYKGAPREIPLSNESRIPLQEGQRIEGTNLVSRAEVEIGSEDIKFLKLVNVSPVLKQWYVKRLNGRPGLRLYPGDSFLSEEASNLQIHGNLSSRVIPQDESGGMTLVTFALVGLLYGGIHACSWNGHFPTDVEQYFWRIAVCIV